MKNSMRCEFCNVDVSKDRCVFAIYNIDIDGKKYYFCCEHHAKEFQMRQKKKK